MLDPSISKALQSFVRGEIAEDALKQYGISFDLDEDILREEFIKSPLVVCTQDVSIGILRKLQSCGSARRWAFIVLQSSRFDFDDNAPNHDEIMQVLWDMSFSNPISPDLLEIISNIANGFDNK